MHYRNLWNEPTASHTLTLSLTDGHGGQVSQDIIVNVTPEAETPASLKMTGEQVRVALLAPDINTVFSGSDQLVTVGDGHEYQNVFRFDISDTNILVTWNPDATHDNGSNNIGGSHSFWGFLFEDVNDVLPDIVGVTTTHTELAVSFDANHVWGDFGFSQYPNLATIQISLEFAIDPIVLDLDGNGVSLLSPQDGVAFDIDADGTVEQIGWMGAGDGLLVMDLDGSGAIENGHEVFSETFGTGFWSSMEALASLDSNGDGRITADDAQFAEILVWQDGNADGISQGGELSTLIDLDIASIDLAVTGSDATNAGNAVNATGSYTLASGETLGFQAVEFSENFSVTGTPGDDTLVSGSGRTFMRGGDGSDLFVLDPDALANIELADMIVDYDYASDGDAIDVSQLLASLSGDVASEAQAAQYLAISHDGADTSISVDGYEVATLAGYAGTVRLIFDDMHSAIDLAL